ncbi:hypothetical protein CL633_02400 [bacterium]|nr:hypothetical protein [bacterium]|tara:strand:- start:3307 stop:3825 length:519 start_codon:yes stop_codon:yes gene_type:complete
MPSETRKDLIKKLEYYSDFLGFKKTKEKKFHKTRKILDVGIAGDKERPSDRYKYFGRGNDFKTLDIDPRWHPDYVGDITGTEFPDEIWDLVIVCQTLEHIWDSHKVFNEAFRILKKEGYLIIDSPWEYPYHDPPDYRRYSTEALIRYCGEAGFNIIDKEQTSNLSIVLCQKP